MEAVSAPAPLPEPRASRGRAARLLLLAGENSRWPTQNRRPWSPLLIAYYPLKARGRHMLNPAKRFRKYFSVKEKSNNHINLSIYENKFFKKLKKNKEN